jgi:glycosyltransferase involved in cell wall biosynthesis
MSNQNGTNIKIVYLISLVESSDAMQWYFTELFSRRSDFLIIFLNQNISELQHKLSARGINCIWLSYTNKKQIVKTFFKVTRLLLLHKPMVVHAHLFDASLVGLIAARLAGIKIRIHTRHHASHHHLYFPHAVRYDRLINYLSSNIIATSQNVKKILVEKEHVDENKISIVHHGFDFSSFENVEIERINAIQSKYNILDKFPVIGVISRYTHWKGIQFTIPAYKNLLCEFPNAVLVLANAKGDFKNEIQELLSQLPENSFREIVFEKDIPALFNSFNAFVHVPIDDHSEAFGQVYIESLAAGCCMICTKSGIALDFIENNRNALVVDYENSDEIYRAIKIVLVDEKKRMKIIETGRVDSKSNFGVEKMVQLTLNIYGV